MNHRCVRLLVCLWVGALSSSVGCAHDPNPSELATRYKEALTTDDPELAWALMSPEARAVTNREEFERRWETSRDARRVLATITTPDDPSPPNLWLEGVTMHASDRRVRWTEVDGVFIATGRFTELDERRSPLAALAAFARALRSTDMSAVYTLLGPELAQASAALLATRAAHLEALLEDPSRITLEGEDHARALLEPGVIIRLQRYPDGWRVVSVGD